ncbi:MAG: hypothetical protein GX455_17225 [Phycisphaerae bacterium]|nr:hypothetical protein [Phycisphaerae bacterium]
MKRMFSAVLVFTWIGLVGCDNGTGLSGDPVAGLFGGKKDLKTESTILEIDAVGNLKSDSAKHDGFVTLSKRDNLSADEQVYLVRKALKGLYLDEDKEEVVWNLIDSDRFSCAVKKEILLLLNQFKSDESRLAILQKLNDTDSCLDASDLAESANL